MNKENTPEVVDKKLTPEIEEQIKRLRGYSPKAVFYWTPDVCKQFLPREEWPIFKYANRTASDVAETEDGWHIYNTDGVLKTNVAGLRLLMISKQVKGWKNYKDRNGNLVECKHDKDGNVTQESIDRLSKEIQVQLQYAIDDEDHLTEEELAGLEF